MTNNQKPTAKIYRRALAAANEKLGWVEIPDCPMERFAQILALREQGHPEMAEPMLEVRARVFNEAAWKSEKVLSITPAEWIPEYAWLYSIAKVDGTFEASPRQIWMSAYVGRPDWNADKVAQLIDELERVGLLQRATADDGKVWGRWVGSEKFAPTKETIESHRYKIGRPDLFPNAPLRSSASAAPALRQSSDGAAPAQRGLGVGVGVGSGEGKGKGLGTAASGSENEQPQEQPQERGVSENLTPKPAEPQNRRRKPVLPPEDYRNEKLVNEELTSPARAATNKWLDDERRKAGFVPDGNGGWKKALTAARR